MFVKLNRVISKLRTGVTLGLTARQDTLVEMRRLVEMDNIVDPIKNFDAQFEYLCQRAARCGLEVYNKNLMWLDEAEFWETWKASSYLNRQRPDRKFVLWSMARSTRNLGGDTAECGVLDGASSYLICSARQDVGPVQHHAFDSFEGLSLPADEDRPTSAFAFRWVPGDLAVSLEEATTKLSRFDNIRYHKGWIPTRFTAVSEHRFSFVHIDVDLYQPTRDSLEFFYPRMVPGGILLCDDYGYHTCPGARKAFDDFAANTIEQSVVHLPTGQGFIVKRSPVVQTG